MWDNGEHATLLAEIREADCKMMEQKSKRKNVETSLRIRQRKCSKFVKEGEFKKARQAAMNIPKWNGSVEDKLKPLYPDRNEKLTEESTSHPLPVTDKWMWYKAIKHANRATSPAASRKCIDHYIQCNIKADR